MPGCAYVFSRKQLPSSNTALEPSWDHFKNIFRQTWDTIACFVLLGIIVGPGEHPLGDANPGLVGPGWLEFFNIVSSPIWVIWSKYPSPHC